MRLILIVLKIASINWELKLPKQRLLSMKSITRGKSVIKNLPERSLIRPIIGGGISGAALGYHLSLYDEAEIVLFEKDRIGCGITAKAAGYSGEYITDKDRIKKILPGINTDRILGAGYTKDDGYFDGTMISNTFVKKMQANGGIVRTGIKVTELIKDEDRVKGLKTDDGSEYEFDIVVDCTGPWSRFTGEMAGIDVPIWHTKAEAFFLSPPIKREGYTFPVIKYPAFYGLKAGDNVFICKSHLSMNLDDPRHAGQWNPDELPQTGGTDEYFIDFLFDQMDTYISELADSGLSSCNRIWW